MATVSVKLLDVMILDFFVTAGSFFNHVVGVTTVLSKSLLDKLYFQFILEVKRSKYSSCSNRKHAFLQIVMQILMH